MKKQITIISPSTSFEIAPNYNFKEITTYFENEGYTIKLENDWLSKTHDIDLKVQAIHNAFLDKSTDIILCSFGGFLSIKLVNKLYYNLIKNNPKPFFGFSDITILLNAIYTKTHIPTYYGPLFISFLKEFKREYVLDYFNKSLDNTNGYDLTNSNQIIDYNDKKEDTLRNNDYWVIRHGAADGITIGGHIPTFNLLQGTEYFPDLKNKILLLEMNELDEQNSLNVFQRLLQSLKLQKNFNELNGILIGSFHSKCEVTFEKLKSIVDELITKTPIPIIANCNFGHTHPIVSIPIGKVLKVTTEATIKITVDQ